MSVAKATTSVYAGAAGRWIDMNAEEWLGSWKEIGAYLQRDARTARRWEKEEGLPVHRLSHKSRSSVYAFPSEIDAWRASRKVVAEPPPPVPLWRSLFAPSRSLAFGMTMLACLIMVGNGVRRVSAQTRQAARQVWAGTGFDVNTERLVSGYGRFLSFIEQGNGNLAIRNLATGENRLLTASEGWRDFAEESIIAADGRQVAYAWWTQETHTNDLRVISTAPGGKATPRVIYRSKDLDFIQPFGWLPDSSGVLAYFWGAGRTTHQIALIRSDGSGATILKSFDWRQSNKLSVSPDGRFIAYDLAPSEDNPEHDIYILAVDGSREVRAVQNPADNQVVGWTPGGDALLFASDRTGSVGLWSIAVADGRPIGQAELLKKDIGRITPLGLSSQGTLYYGMRAGIRDVYTVSIVPKTLKPVSEPVLAAQRFLGTNAGADWSPDGKYLAYASRRGSTSRSPSVLTIHSLADGSERDVVTKLAYILEYHGIRWSPDGRAIFVRGVDRKGLEGLYKVSVETGETVLAARGITTPPVWSPDRRTMYFLLRAHDGTNQIVALDTRDNAERLVYRSPKRTFAHITISPDGKNLPCTDNPDEHSQTK